MTLMRFTPLRNGCLIIFKKCVRETEKNQKLLIRNFNFTRKKYDFKTLILETSEYVLSICISNDWFPLKFAFIYNIYLM